MFRRHFKTLRVKSTNERYKDSKGNGLLSRSQSEEEPKPEFGGTIISQATMLSPLESICTDIIVLEPLNPTFQRHRLRAKLRLVRITKQ